MIEGIDMSDTIDQVKKVFKDVANELGIIVLKDMRFPYERFIHDDIDYGFVAISRKIDPNNCYEQIRKDLLFLETSHVAWYGYGCEQINNKFKIRYGIVTDGINVWNGNRVC